jgi:hypothetical protein
MKTKGKYSWQGWKNDHKRRKKYLTEKETNCDIWYGYVEDRTDYVLNKVKKVLEKIKL